LFPNTFKFLAFHYFDLERTWWRLFQKRVVRTKFDIYVFIITFNYKLKRLIEMIDYGTHTLYCSTNIVWVWLPLTTKMHVVLFWRLSALPFHSLTLIDNKHTLNCGLSKDCDVLLLIYNHTLIIQIESDQWLGTSKTGIHNCASWSVECLTLLLISVNNTQQSIQHLGSELVLFEQAYFIDWILFVKYCHWLKYSFFWYPWHILPLSFRNHSCMSSSLPVDRKYQKGQSTDNYIILLFNSKCKPQWMNIIFLQRKEQYKCSV